MLEGAGDDNPNWAAQRLVELAGELRAKAMPEPRPAAPTMRNTREARGFELERLEDARAGQAFALLKTGALRLAIYGELAALSYPQPTPEIPSDGVVALRERGRWAYYLVSWELYSQLHDEEEKRATTFGAWEVTYVWGRRA